jgi:hypothetical protein
MPTPNPVGRIHYDQPRAVVVREPENLDKHHSAIHCGVNIYVDSLAQGKYLLDNWALIMADLSNSIEDVLDSYEEEQTPMGETVDD